MKNWVLVLLVFGIKVCFGQTVGKVVGVKNGDTIEVLVDGRAVVVRFEHVDCPEIGGGSLIVVWLSNLFLIFVLVRR